MILNNLFPIRISTLMLMIWLPVLLSAQNTDSVSSQNSSVLTDSMFQIIDNMHERSASLESMTKYDAELDLIKKNLPSVVAVIESLDATLKYGAQYLDMKSLNTFGQLLDGSKTQLDVWRKQLLNYNQQISTTEEDINRMRAFPLLNADSSNHFFVDLYNTELASLESSWQQLKQNNDQHQKEIQELQAIISRNYYKSADLQRDLADQLTSYSLRTFGKETNYLWEKQALAKQDEQEVAFSKISLQINQQIFVAYFLENINTHLFFALLIFIAFIFWVRKNYRKVLSMDDHESVLQSLEDPHTMSSLPVLSAFMVMFSLWPFLDLNAPEAYIIIIQLLLFVTTSIFIFKYGTNKERLIWAGVLVMYILSGVIGTSYHFGLWLRLGLIFINLYLIYSARAFLRLQGGDVRIKGITRALLYATILVNITAAILNFAGRITLAETLTSAGLIGFVQVIGLSIFKDIVITAVQLQNVVNSFRENQRSFLDMEAISNRIFNLLSFLTLFLCFAVFATNMNFYTSLHKGVTGLLFDPRTVGTTTFTVGNILLFFVVIYLSTLAQRYVGYLFGENSEHSIPEGKKGSKVVIWKLIIIVIGFALAIMVSGLPLDKVTIVLSAFGVGIGLGLQNVVNNFVSGLILIFERPLQVGDYVEVGGLKGWVKDIGIRATRMVNNDGAEMIVPNGSILAGNLTNWTLSSSRIRVEMQLKITPLSALVQAKEIITEEILNYEHALNNMPPEILQISLSNTTTELKVWFWIDHINRKESAKSAILNAIHTRLDQNGITMG